MIAVVFAQGAWGIPAAGWVTIAITVLGLVGTGIKAWVDSKAADSTDTKTSAEVRKVEVRADSQRFSTEHGLAARLLDEANAERRAVEADRDRLAQSHVALTEENAALSFAKLSLEGKVDDLERRISGLETEVRECHEARADDMRRMTDWVRDVLSTGRLSEAPKPRSLTPAHDMQAVARSIPSATKERSPT